MKITITAKKMQIPQNFTDYAQERVSQKLDKFFGEEADAKITISEYKSQIILELTVFYNQMIYRLPLNKHETQTKGAAYLWLLTALRPPVSVKSSVTD